MAIYDPFAIYEHADETISEIVTLTESNPSFDLTEFQKGLLIAFILIYLMGEI